MSWMGYFEFGGTEIINVSRTEEYISTFGMRWFRPVFKNTALPTLLNQTYINPLVDQAPWVDPDDPNSYRFCGFYPLSIVGIEDSTDSAPITESTLNGGVVGRNRSATRTMVFNGLLIGASERGTEYGLRWLKSVLKGAQCGDTFGCSGADLCYLNSEPGREDGACEAIAVEVADLIYDGGTPSIEYPDSVDGGDSDLEYETSIDAGGPVTETQQINDLITLNAAYFAELSRNMRNVALTRGATVTRKMRMTDDCEVWAVQFTITAANPFEFSAEVPLIEGFLEPTVANPYVGGTPPGGIYDETGEEHSDTDCAIPGVLPVFDPLCPAVILPPAPPKVPLGCLDLPTEWVRRAFTIPDQYVSDWGETVPYIAVHATNGDVRTMRIKFYAQPDGDTIEIPDDCASCADIVISYVPADTTLVIDASDQVVYVESPGGVKRRADSLVFRGDGMPIDWPTLTCGMGYTVAVDMTEEQPLPVIDLSLYARMP